MFSPTQATIVFTRLPEIRNSFRTQSACAGKLRRNCLTSFSLNFDISGDFYSTSSSVGVEFSRARWETSQSVSRSICQAESVRGRNGILPKRLDKHKSSRMLRAISKSTPFLYENVLRKTLSLSACSPKMFIIKDHFDFDKKVTSKDLFSKIRFIYIAQLTGHQFWQRSCSELPCWVVRTVQNFNAKDDRASRGPSRHWFGRCRCWREHRVRTINKTAMRV